MSTLSLEEKQQQILENEQTQAQQLAILVLEKPVPPIWMIFIPIFFVFHAWKIKQYANGLKNFAEHYLVSRRRALDAVVEAERHGGQVEIESLLRRVETLPDAARPLFSEWMTLLTAHYRSLLSAPGNSHPALIRAGYRNKSNYLLFCNRLTKAEHAFNLALLPQIHGETEDLREVIEKMERGATELRRRESDEIFA